MRTNRRTEQVEGSEWIRYPVPERLVDRSAQRPIAALHLDHPGSESAHPQHVRRLAMHVHGSHVNLARKTDPGAGGGRGDAVLPGPRLGDDPPHSEMPGQEGLSQRIVDLVGSGVRQVFALQPQIGAPALAEP